VHQLTNHAGSDRTPRWSPDGQWLAFVVAWDAGYEQIAITPVTGGTPIQCTYDRHANTDLAWSPNSQTIAFSSQRSDEHLFAATIGIFHLGTGKKQLLDHPPTANERTPRFSPDGQKLVFVSDRDGWDSLWLYDIQSDGLHKLNIGPGELAHPAWSPDSLYIAFTSTEGVWSRVGCFGLNDNKVNWWSPEVGTAFSPSWSPDGKQLAYIWSDAVTPREIWVVDADTGARQSATRTAAGYLPVATLVQPERITYAGTEGVAVDALLYSPQPTQRSGGGILYVHGGPNWLTRDMYDPFLQYLVVEEGHTILAPNVRGSTGYGRAYMDMNMGDYGGLDQQDWVAGIDTLTSQGRVDPYRIGIWGRSYGGFATMLSLCQYPERFACGVALFGVSDWFNLWDQATPWVRRLMAHQLGHPWRDRDRYRKRSPLTYVERMQAPLLLLHGDADVGVPLGQSLTLAAALAERNHPHEIQIYSGEGHGFNAPHHIQDAAARITNFFRRNLC
jgi:dipeptidyl aminopeptidase/acylaminoacyl peptidase